MSRDVLDLSAKGIESPLAGPLIPFPGNLNTIDPQGWEDIFWADVGDALGLDLRHYQPRLTRYDAVGLSIAIQCADVVAEDIARAEMVIWRKQVTGGRREYIEVEPNEHWLARMLVRRPNSFMSWKQLWRMTVLHLKLASNAYLVKRIARDGTVLELVPVLPFRVRERIGENGRLFYEVALQTEYERALHGVSLNQSSTIVLPAERIIHMQGRMWSGLKGLSNMELGAGFFRLVDSISEYQTHLFGSDGTTPLAFETDHSFTGDMADAAFRRLKQQLAERLRKSRTSGDPLLLEAGLKAKPIAINSRDSMTTETYNLMVNRICGLMRVSPHKLMHLDSQKYENLSTSNDAYANTSLIPVTEEIEEQIRLSLIDENDWGILYPEFDRMTLMATDMQSLSKVLDTFTKNGVMELNEVRERLPLGLNPMPNGDVRYVPVNVALVDRDGNVIAQAASGQNEGTGQDENAEQPEDAETQERRLRLVSNKD